MLKFLFLIMNHSTDKPLNPLLVDLVQRHQYAALIAAVRMETALKPNLTLEERQRFLLLETMALAEMGNLIEAKTLFQEVRNIPQRSNRIENALKLVEFDLFKLDEELARGKK